MSVHPLALFTVVPLERVHDPLERNLPPVLGLKNPDPFTGRPFGLLLEASLGVPLPYLLALLETEETLRDDKASKPDDLNDDASESTEAYPFFRYQCCDGESLLQQWNVQEIANPPEEIERPDFLKKVDDVHLFAIDIFHNAYGGYYIGNLFDMKDELYDFLLSLYVHRQTQKGGEIEKYFPDLSPSIQERYETAHAIQTEETLPTETIPPLPEKPFSFSYEECGEVKKTAKENKKAFYTIGRALWRHVDKKRHKNNLQALKRNSQNTIARPVIPPIAYSPQSIQNGQTIPLDAEASSKKKHPPKTRWQKLRNTLTRIRIWK